MDYPGHTSTQFDAELKNVITNVLRMGEAVESQFRLAIESLATGDSEKIDQVINNGVEINAMEIAIDESCINILVRRQPTANDLRLVKTIIKTINDLERIGDEAESIACSAKLIFHQGFVSFPRHSQIKSVAGIALDLLREALVAFDGMDSAAAKKVWRKDTVIDEKFHSILRHLVAYMMEDNSEFSIAMQAALLARSIERAGDHAKNISGYVVYMMEGRINRD
jgi:phosphate transport system protein